MMAMLSPLSLNILMPALPSIAAELAISSEQVQLSLTLYLLFLALGQLVCGPLADRFGRRPVLLGGIALHSIGCLLGAFANSIEGLLLARILQAAGGCAGMVLARTMMLDCYARSEAAGKIGYITLSIAIAQASAPTLGGQLTEWVGWQTVFHFSLLLSGVTWLIALWIIPETLLQRSDSIRLTAVLARYRSLLGNRQFIGYCGASTLIACGFFLFIGSAPYLVAQQLGGSPADYGNWFLVVALGFMAGSFSAAKISASLGIERMINLGNTLSTLGAFIALVASSLLPLSYLSLFLPMALYTFGRGFSQPNNQSAAIASCNSGPGAASGLMGFLQLVMGATVAQCGPLIVAAGAEYLALTLLTFALLAVLINHWTQQAS